MGGAEVALWRVEGVLAATGTYLLLFVMEGVVQAMPWRLMTRPPTAPPTQMSLSVMPVPGGGWASFTIRYWSKGIEVQRPMV